jgi:hypothetical protein
VCAEPVDVRPRIKHVLSDQPISNPYLVSVGVTAISERLGLYLGDVGLFGFSLEHIVYSPGTSIRPYVWNSHPLVLACVMRPGPGSL